MTDGLSCTCAMPLTWRMADPAGQARENLIHEAALLLNAINQMESSHELEAGGADNRRLERLEAKLDLALHLLAQVLQPGPAPDTREVRLTPQELEWAEATPPQAGAALLLELRPSPHLPLTLRLPAVAREAGPGLARARLDNLSPALDEALYQFVFRRHRQAIRSRAGV